MNDLRNRLQRLRQQSGSAAASAAGLQQRLQTAHRVRNNARGSDRGSGRTRISVEELAGCLNGQPVADGVIVIDRIIAFDSLHGDWRVSASPSSYPYFGFADQARPLFIDTETSGLAGGSGTVAFLLGLGKFTDRGLHLRQYFLSEFRGESVMLADAARFSAGTDLLVSYNGKGFDLPLLDARCRLAAIANPWSAHPHWDLLHGVRRAFQKNWPDCRLRSVETRLLGFVRVNDLPGEQVPAAWFAWLTNADTRLLPQVIRHNYWDVLSLAAGASLLPFCYQRPERYGADPIAAARLLLEQDKPQLALAHLSMHRTRLNEQAKLLLAGLARRCDDWELALSCWRELARCDISEALERLAKYYEHIQRDYVRALRCSERLLELQPEQKNHRRRVQRLQRKAAASGLANPQSSGE